MEGKIINDEELSIVSGGILAEGWEKTLSSMMGIYKFKYGDEGREKLKNVLLSALDDPTSPLEPQDMETIHNYIDENWDSVPSFKF